MTWFGFRASTVHLFCYTERLTCDTLELELNMMDLQGFGAFSASHSSMVSLVTLPFGSHVSGNVSPVVSSSSQLMRYLVAFSSTIALTS